MIIFTQGPVTEKQQSKTVASRELRCCTRRKIVSKTKFQDTGEKKTEDVQMWEQKADTVKSLVRFQMQSSANPIHKNPQTHIGASAAILLLEALLQTVPGSTSTIRSKERTWEDYLFGSISFVPALSLLWDVERSTLEQGVDGTCEKAEHAFLNFFTERCVTFFIKPK